MILCVFFCLWYSFVFTYFSLIVIIIDYVESSYRHQNDSSMDRCGRYSLCGDRLCPPSFVTLDPPSSVSILLPIYSVLLHNTFLFLAGRNCSTVVFWTESVDSRRFTFMPPWPFLCSFSWVRLFWHYIINCCCLDAVREVRKYSEADVVIEGRRALENDAMIHMRLFRSQRNLYISGFALLLFVVISRLVTLISRTAALQASADAAIRQAEGANKAARTLMEAVSCTLITLFDF